MQVMQKPIHLYLFSILTLNKEKVATLPVHVALCEVPFILNSRYLPQCNTCMQFFFSLLLVLFFSSKKIFYSFYFHSS
jgi:hypothetical protein